MNLTNKPPKTQDVTIIISDVNNIEFERENRYRGAGYGAWYKRDGHRIDKMSKASLHRLIRVAESLQWDYRERDNVYMGGYYAPSISEEQIFTLNPDGDGSGNFLANWLRQLCGCSECWSDETGALHPDDSELK